jgi:oligopeptide/dipeptide ABC transporter ATP-binding protein
MQPNSTIVDIRNLSVQFSVDNIFNTAVEDVSFKIRSGETLGMVGESGCGKSVTAMCIMKLVPCPPGRINGGKILFQGEDLVKKSNKEMHKIRGNQISMIFQEPMTSLNPVFTIGSQITETVRIHQKVGKREAIQRAEEILIKVGIAAPAKRLNEYPHQLSGGMKQRVMIAMALLCNPKLLIADEPTTALDVTIQSQILDLMVKLKEETGTSILMITHDLGVIAETSSRVAVMYAGRIVEEAPARKLFANPMHPYTEGLLQSLPRIGHRDKLSVIPGIVPELTNWPSGCRFHPRCQYAMKRCMHEDPPLLEIGEEHAARCWLRSE